MFALLHYLVAVAFANANAGSKLFVCATPQNSNLTAPQLAALDWTEIGGVGSLGETGKTTNILTYDTWGDSVSQKAKGLTDAGSPELETARMPGDPGQEILLLAAEVGNVNNYAFKELRNDGTIRYNRGLVTGPTWPGGRNEDFDLQVFTLGFQMEPIVVNPTGGGVVGNPPLLTVAPTITDDGTPAVGEELTLSNGTFTGDTPMTYTYQWYAGGVPIAGATNATYTPTTVDIGKVITARVTALNASGSAVGFTEPTVAVIAA